MAILSAAPKGAQVLDLGAARAARAEVRTAAGISGRYLKLSAGFVEVRLEIAISTAFDLEEGRLREGLGALLVDPADLDPLLADGLSSSDLEELTAFITGGVTPGE
jgi:hypothetical protein